MTSRSFRSLAQCAPAAFVLWLGAMPAFGAGNSESPAAQALFDQGKKLLAAGKFAEACPKFDESQRLDPALGTLLNLADCYEKAGLLASAWSKFVEAQGTAHSEGRTRAEQVARERAAKISPRLSKLVIELPPEADSLAELQIKRDGLNVGRAQWGVPIPTDPGSHVVGAAAPGRKSWETRVDVAPNATTATVRVPLLEAEPAPVVATLPPAQVGLRTGEDSGSSTPRSSGGLGAQRGAALAAVGIGVVGGVIGTVFGVKSISKHNQANSECSDAGCTPSGLDLKAAARSAGNTSTAGFIVAALGLGGGAVLWFTAKGPQGDAPSTAIGAGPGTLFVRGTW